MRRLRLRAALALLLLAANVSLLFVYTFGHTGDSSAGAPPATYSMVTDVPGALSRPEFGVTAAMGLSVAILCGLIALGLFVAFARRCTDPPRLSAQLN